MGQGASKANLEQIVQIAKTKINFAPPLGAPNPVSTLCGDCVDQSQLPECILSQRVRRVVALLGMIVVLL
jgi:hypothetical protein